MKPEIKFKLISESKPMQNIDIILYPDYSGDCVIGWFDGSIYYGNDGRKIEPTQWSLIPTVIKKNR